MKRTRQYKDALIARTLTKGEMDHADPEPFVVSVESILVPREDHRESLMVDSKDLKPLVRAHKKKFNLKDCDHDSYQGAYGVPNFETQQLDPYIQWREPASGFARWYKAPASHAIHDVKARLGPSAVCPFTAARVEPWLTAEWLPTKIHIDNDPFESDFSIWFLVADIQQIPKLTKAIFSREIIRRRQAFSGKTFKQLADDDLLVKFGVIATYRDVCDFVGTIKRFRDGIDAYEVHRDKVYFWHSQPGIDISESCPTPVGGFLAHNPFGVVNTLHTAFTHALGTCTHSRTMHYRFLAPEMSTWLARVKQFIDAFGVLDPAALWDLIPFTFIADWFTNWGTWFHNNRPRLYPASISIEDYCESISMKWSTFWFADNWGVDDIEYNANLDLSSPILIGEEQHKTYVRRRFTPRVDYVKQATRHPLFRWTQMQIASSLVAQRLPRPGNVGEDFEAVNFHENEFPAGSAKAIEIDEINRNWAKKQAAARASNYRPPLHPGGAPRVWKFESERPEHFDKHLGNPDRLRRSRGHVRLDSGRNLFPGVIVRDLGLHGPLPKPIRSGKGGVIHL